MRQRSLTTMALIAGLAGVAGLVGDSLVSDIKSLEDKRERQLSRREEKMAAAELKRAKKAARRLARNKS